MHHPNPPIPKADGWIAGTKADGLLLERDRLFYRPRVELAPAEIGVCVRRVPVERNHRLVFGNSLVVSVLGAQELAFGPMRERVPGRRRQGLPDQPVRTFDVG